MFDLAKPWYLSRTIVAILVSALAKGLAIWGYALTPDLRGDLVTLILALVGCAGDALAIFGRVKATKAIGRQPGDGDPPLGIGAAVAVLFVVFALAGPLAACATYTAETPQQQAYALEADYQAAQRAALAYVSGPAADPAIAGRVVEAEAAVYATVAAVRAEAEALRRAPPDSPEAARRRLGLAAALAAAREGLATLTRHLEPTP